MTISYNACLCNFYANLNVIYYRVRRSTFFLTQNISAGSVYTISVPTIKLWNDDVENNHKKSSLCVIHYIFTHRLHNC